MFEWKNRINCGTFHFFFFFHLWAYDSCYILEYVFTPVTKTQITQLG